MANVISLSRAERPGLHHRVDDPARYWSGSSDMAYEADAFRVAKLVIERQGRNAAWWASQRLREFQVEKDAIGVDLWRAIRGAIEELQRP